MHVQWEGERATKRQQNTDQNGEWYASVVNFKINDLSQTVNSLIKIRVKALPNTTNVFLVQHFLMYTPKISALQICRTISFHQIYEKIVHMVLE